MTDSVTDAAGNTFMEVTVRDPLSGLVTVGVTTADNVSVSVPPFSVGATTAVVTVKDGLNIPRYPSVPGRIRAKKKPIERSTPEKPAARIEKKQFVQPESTGKQTEFLDAGGDAASRLVEVFRQIGVI